MAYVMNVLVTHAWYCESSAINRKCSWLQTDQGYFTLHYIRKTRLFQSCLHELDMSTLYTNFFFYFKAICSMSNIFTLHTDYFISEPSAPCLTCLLYTQTTLFQSFAQFSVCLHYIWQVNSKPSAQSMPDMSTLQTDYYISESSA